MAMAIFGMGVVLAPAMGPILGGWLTDNYGWPWVFYINIPVSIVGIVMFSAFVEDPPYLRRGIARVDWAGIALLTLGLIVMQIVLERAMRTTGFTQLDHGWRPHDRPDVDGPGVLGVTNQRAHYQFSRAAQYPAEYRCGDGLALWDSSLWYYV